MSIAPINQFVAIVFPVSLVVYLLVRLIRRYCPWLRNEGKRYIPVLTLVLGLLLGAVPGLIEGLARLTQPASPIVNPPAAILLGGLGGFLAPTVYAWFHKVIKMK